MIPDTVYINPITLTTNSIFLSTCVQKAILDSSVAPKPHPKGNPTSTHPPGTLGASCKALLRRLESSKWMACLTYSNRGVFVCGILDIKEEVTNKSLG